MMVEKRQSRSRAVQGYTTGCSPAPEPPTALGKALSSWKEQERGSIRKQGVGATSWSPGQSPRPFFFKLSQLWPLFHPGG